MPTDKALPLLGMVLVTHGRLAEEMVTAMEHVVGPQRAIATVALAPTTIWRCAAAKSPMPSGRSMKGAASSC